MTSVRCLDCGDTFPRAQTALHGLEKHPHGFPVRYTTGDTGATAYQEDQ